MVVAALSLWGAALVILLFGGSKLYSLSMIAATILPPALYASRNPRLFFLWGMVFSAGLGLSINFNRMVHIGGAPSFSIDLMDLFLAPLVVFLVRDFAVGYRRDFKVSWVSAWWLGLIALGVLDIVQGPMRQFPSFEVIRMLKCWLLFLVIINECTREKHFHHVVMALLAGVALNVVVAAVQFTLKRDLGLQALGEPSPEAILGANYGVYLSAGSAYRVGALMGHPNLFAAYLAMLLPIFIGLVYTSYRTSTKLLLVLVSAGGVLALVLTLSRAGWADFALAMAFLTLTLFAHPALRNRYVRLKGTMLAAMFLGLLLASGQIIQRITGSDSGALDFRQEWVEIAWHMVGDKPVLGFGLNTFAYHLVGYTQYGVGDMIKRFGQVWPAVHNIYLLVWAEQGSIGMLLFIGLHVHVFWLGIQSTRQVLSEKVFMINIGALCGLVAVMLDGFASFFIRVPASGRIFWIVIGLVVAAHYWNQRNAALRQQRPTAVESGAASDTDGVATVAAQTPGTPV